MRYRKLMYFLAVPFVCSVLVCAQKQSPNSAVNQPQRVAFRQEFLQQLKTPPGFAVNVFASNTGQPRMMSVSSDGSIYVTRPEQSDVIMLRDKNGDGNSDEMKTVLSGISLAHGITIRDNKLYVAGVNELYVSDLNGQNKQKLIANLPEGGRHPKRTIGFDPHGMLYLSIGSTCNACDEANPEHATILQVSTNGSNRKVYARGLRNTMGFDWHPETKEFWGMDNGSDDRGDNIPPEELNRIQEGADYGWPYCYGNKEEDPFTDQPKGITKAEYCAKTIGPVLTYQAHSAPIEMRFYNNNQFPAEYRGDAFVTMHGSWNRSVPTGFKVVRLRFKNGSPQQFEDFLTGFLIQGGTHQFGRPAGLAVMKDGSLLVSDDENGLIYRVRYKSQTAERH
jgi:glucose/arabinose dehydrogenase